MAQYISKDALVAEINRVLNSYDPNEITSGRYALVNLRDFLDTLEVKEVDLDEEFDKCCKNYVFDDECEVYTARHFFELGMAISNKAQKGE